MARGQYGKIKKKPFLIFWNIVKEAKVQKGVDIWKHYLKLKMVEQLSTQTYKKYMKTITFKQEITKPKLEISNDEFTNSPREWSNLGYFITVDRNYYSPDRNETLERIVKETGQEAGSQEEHMEMIKSAIEEDTDEKVLAIYPVVKYEHSGVSYSLGTVHNFDYSNNGFYIITEESQKELGTDKKDFEKVIKQELEVYNKYVNGEVYEFCLYDDNGEVADSCGGFYDIEDIREYLPEEWSKEDLTEYVKY